MYLKCRQESSDHFASASMCFHPVQIHVTTWFSGVKTEWWLMSITVYCSVCQQQLFPGSYHRRQHHSEQWCHSYNWWNPRLSPLWHIPAIVSQPRFEVGTGERSGVVSRPAVPLIARFMGPSGDHRTQVGPMLAPWILLSGSAWYKETDGQSGWWWSHKTPLALSHPQLFSNTFQTYQGYWWSLDLRSFYYGVSASWNVHLTDQSILAFLVSSFRSNNQIWYNCKSKRVTQHQGRHFIITTKFLCVFRFCFDNHCWRYHIHNYSQIIFKVAKDVYFLRQVRLWRFCLIEYIHDGLFHELINCLSI